MTWLSIALLLFCIALEITRELCFKLGVNDLPFMKMLMRSPLLWLGVAIWGVEMFAWIKVLETVPLSVAFPMVSLVYCGVPLAGHWLLGETVTRRHWIGTGLITLGVAMVGATGL